MRIIIAIDILGGKCVRLTRGDFNSSRMYNNDPVEVAKQIEDHGIRYIHLVDLDGARLKHVVNHKILQKISSKTSLKIDFGGGIRSGKDLEMVFSNGANQVTGGSIAVNDPGEFLEWLSLYGSDKIILGADCINRKISTGGWKEITDLDVTDFIKSYTLKGVEYVVCTDISRDGMMEGPSFSLYRDILSGIDVNLIASGGITTMDDLVRLKMAGCEGSIVGKSVYEGKMTLKELSSIC
jgi:phosphoribosylformimino-5-aminoimidazole carboxamide ribotide isomerase